MVAAGVIFSGVIVSASLLQTQSANLILLLALLGGGAVAWRSKRGEFYKDLAEERGDENEKLRAERDRFKAMTDITPIVKELKSVTAALNEHAEMTSRVFEKVADMNGALRAHGEAMKALADHLILDEAARALLAEAAVEKPHRPTRRTP